MRNKIAALFALGAACLALPAGAAMYRCGNVFQDRPCDASAEQQVIRPGKGAGKAVAPAGAAQPAAPAAADAAKSAGSAAVAAAATAASSARPQASAPATPASAARPGAGASAACSNLREQRNALDARLRSASSANTIEVLQRQRRAVETNLAEAGC
jgi:hypothetical protein